MTDVLQCPECELRFTSRSELEMHIAVEEDCMLSQPA
jgi:hypothetical protein